MKRFIAHFKDFVTLNTGTKLLALFLAAVSWYAIRRAISFEVTTPDVRVEVAPPQGFAVQFQSESSVDVSFRGSQEDIRFLDVKRLVVAVDMQHIDEAGSYEVNLSPDQVGGARGVRPFRVNPSKLRIELDREEEKRVPLKARIVGRPLSGQVESYSCDPEVVLLRGPARQLQTVDQVWTVPIDVDGRIEPFSRRVPIAQPGDSWVAQIEPSEALVQVEITPTPASREWSGQRIRVLIEPHRRHVVRIRPERVDVTVSGNADALERLNDPLVYVDCAGLKPDTVYELPVFARVNDTDVVILVEPASASVTLQEY